MLSVNTNYSAMVALQNLNSTNKDLESVQQRISTGLKVSNAKDNGAVFAIAEGQRARVSAVAAVKDGIDRASSTLDVALEAGKSIGDILKELSAKAVAAQADDLTPEQRNALQADFSALRSQIDTIANSAQFNGANLVSGGANDLNVLISDLGGGVGASGTGIQTANAGPILSSSALITALGVTDTDTETFALTGGPGAFSFSVTITATMTIDDFVNAVNSASGGKVSASYDDTTGNFTYLVNDPDYTGMTITHADTDTSGADTAINLGATIASGPVTSSSTNTYTITGRDWTLNGALFTTFSASNIATSAAAATTAADAISTALTSLNEQMAAMGSQAKAIDIQQAFLAKLSDSIENGIGNLVDADLAKESARLQSLQIKQQLGAQALSIANQAPQVILSLFRG